MQLTLLALGLCAANLAASSPIGLNIAGAGAAAGTAPAAPAAAGSATAQAQGQGQGQALSSDGHRITNPAFDGAANFDLDALLQKGQGMELVAGSAPTAAAAAGNAGVAAGALSDDAAIAAEVAAIEKQFGKRDEMDGDAEGEVDGDVDEVEGEEMLEKREPGTLTAYLIYCLKHPKQCRAVKVQ